jgi:hypothetical protein
MQGFAYGIPSSRAAVIRNTSQTKILFTISIDLNLNSFL